MFSRNGKTYKCIAAFLVAVFAFFMTGLNHIISVDAGSSKVYVVSTASVSGENINGGDFKIDGGVYAKDSKVVFDETTSRTARLLAKARIYNLKEYGVKDVFSASFTFEFKQLADGGKAAFAFGLKKAGNGLGSEGSGEVAFTYDADKNCIAIEVNEYTAEGVPTVVAAKNAYNILPLHSEITVNMEVRADKKVYLSVTSNVNAGVIDILKGKTLTVDPEGYVAFVSQSTDVKNIFDVSNINITAYAYDVAETVNHYIETFDKNSYNANMFYSETTASGISPSKIFVEEGKLVFKNVGQGYFTTKEKYSNFELKFDIVDLYRKGETDTEGNIIKLISHWFMIGFGVDNYNDPPSERIQATFLQFEGLPGNSLSNPSNHLTGEVANGTKDRYVLWNNGSAVNIQSMKGDVEQGKFSLWNDEYIGNETVNLKFTVVDGVITLYYKLASQAEYTMQYQYNLGTMQTGYVRIYSYGGGPLSEYAGVLNMTIDNFEITNLDNDAVKIIKNPPIYKSNVVAKTPDYNYTTTPDASDLLNNKLKK